MASRALPSTLEELAVLHATDDRFLKAKLSQLSKPKLGQKPLTPEQIDAQTAKLTTEMRERQATERLELEARIARGTAMAAPAAMAGSVQELPQAASVEDERSEPATPKQPLEALSPAATPGSTGTRAERRRVRDVC
jgi:hypothetical protein